MSVVFDASAVLTIAFAEDGADVAIRDLEGALMSSVNASEVVAKFIDRGSSPEEARIAFLKFNMKVRPFDQQLAIAAGQMRAQTRTRGLSLGDRACLAFASREGARVVTADRSWKDVNLGVEITVIR
ncbi:MAG: type II toxin-antitoxin system VapC family toxin [Acidobacteria bacterium]|nr:type II toxin-antitoxin system VapC family toxin [Acidobacteriota bacterium]MXZ72298.1 type II toxin-antitoxin system VapC family toxin [Acidobacteriota bacterium]MYD71225.1 type II toxin-antitoxin system VapC family toxin [Acidobacteriota bacterium]MYJ03919.1 type II toxin-antitoxin system VapC family toxin [Acidobacteriota bacterium]